MIRQLYKRNYSGLKYLVPGLALCFLIGLATDGWLFAAMLTLFLGIECICLHFLPKGNSRGGLYGVTGSVEPRWSEPTTDGSLTKTKDGSVVWINIGKQNEHK